MLSERAAKCLADIVAAVELIQSWIMQAGGIEPALSDTLVRSGIERQILIVSEAAIRLDKMDPKLAPALAPEIDWPGIRGIGNFIRHKYDDLDTQIIADALANRVEELRAACKLALSTAG